jgi:hypothetical protein
VADYNKLTNFASKDGLPSGDPAKIVKGTEIDSEFTAIANAVASKANINSPNFTGTPSGPTALAGTSTNQLATTAFVTSALGAIYPVGSVYINASSSSNPSVLLGFGTWVEFGAGRVMVGQDAGDTLFDTLEETGGSKDAVVVSHTHTATVTDPGHLHNSGTSFLSSNVGSLAGATGTAGQYNTTIATSTTGISVSNSTTGVSGTNANVQPYITVKMWKRTA